MSKQQKIQSENLDSEDFSVFRERYQRVLTWLVIMGLLGVVLAITLGYMVYKPGHHKYYASTTTGVVERMYPLSEPVITQKFLLQWASLSTRTALNLSFTDYQNQMAQAKDYFTPDGWDKFKAALQSSGLLGTVIQQKLIMSAIVSGTPVVINSGVVNGRYTWRVQLPLLVTFNSTSTARKDMLITMDIQRVPVLGAKKGIEIAGFSAARMN